MHACNMESAAAVRQNAEVVDMQGCRVSDFARLFSLSGRGGAVARVGGSRRERRRGQSGLGIEFEQGQSRTRWKFSKSGILVKTPRRQSSHHQEKQTQDYQVAVATSIEKFATQRSNKFARCFCLPSKSRSRSRGRSLAAGTGLGASRRSSGRSRPPRASRNTGRRSGTSL